MAQSADQLFAKCKQSGQPFFLWNSWIKNHIESALVAYEQYKKARLSKMASRGQSKLIEKVEEKMMQESRRANNYRATTKNTKK